jgi:hypothetical protein
VWPGCQKSWTNRKPTASLGTLGRSNNHELSHMRRWRWGEAAGLLFKIDALGEASKSLDSDLLTSASPRTSSPACSEISDNLIHISAKMEKTTQSDLRLIASSFRKCLSLWQEIKGLCKGRTFLEDEVFRAVSASFEETIQSGENSVNQSFQIVPRDKQAFERGDGTESLIIL